MRHAIHPLRLTLLAALAATAACGDGDDPPATTNPIVDTFDTGSTSRTFNAERFRFFGIASYDAATDTFPAFTIDGDAYPAQLEIALGSGSWSGDYGNQNAYCILQLTADNTLPGEDFTDDYPDAITGFRLPRIGSPSGGGPGGGAGGVLKAVDPDTDLAADTDDDTDLAADTDPATDTDADTDADTDTTPLPEARTIASTNCEGVLRTEGMQVLEALTAESWTFYFTAGLSTDVSNVLDQNNVETDDFIGSVLVSPGFTEPLDLFYSYAFEVDEDGDALIRRDELVRIDGDDLVQGGKLVRGIWVMASPFVIN